MRDDEFDNRHSKIENPAMTQLRPVTETATAWQGADELLPPDVAIMLSLSREISLQGDPQDLVRVFRKFTPAIYGGESFVAISRRGLDAPAYRVTRASRWAADVNPWLEQEKLPLFEGGLLSELIYSDTPRVLRDVSIPRSEPAHEFLQDARALLALPMFDDGVGLNMVVRMSPQPDGFDRVSLASSLLTANLFGRATNNLLAAKRLREAHAQIDHELKRVAHLQRLLLPREFPRIPGVDVAASYSTAARAGGDYYDFFDLGDGRWGLWISDVSGHGALAAVVMAMLRTLLHARCLCDSSPGDVLGEINEHLSRESQRLPGMFVTAFYGVYDPRDGSLRYASAGHNPPLVMSRDSAVRQLDQSQSVPLAVLPDAEFEIGVDRLAPGDTILLYTDGITEAMNPAGEMYGLDRLLSCVREDVPNAQHIVDCVTFKLMAFTGELPQSDDRTLVAMRIRD